MDIILIICSEERVEYECVIVDVFHVSFAFISGNMKRHPSKHTKFYGKKVDRSVISTNIYKNVIKNAIQRSETASAEIASGLSTNESEMLDENTPTNTCKLAGPLTAVTEIGDSEIPTIGILAENTSNDTRNLADLSTPEKEHRICRHRSEKNYNKLKKMHSEAERLKLAKKFVVEEEEWQQKRVTKYSEYLTKANLCQLDTISPRESMDTTFIRVCLEILYRDNLSVLRNRSLHGKSYSNRETLNRRHNLPLSPLKTNVIRELFRERVVRSGVETNRRLSTDYVNTRISNTLSSIKRQINLD